jgi:hypothetical protein
LLAVCRSGWLVVFARPSLRRDSIHMSGIAVTLTSKPGHEKSCPCRVHISHPAATTTQAASANNSAPAMRLALRSTASAKDLLCGSSTLSRQSTRPPPPARSSYLKLTSLP